MACFLGKFGTIMLLSPALAACAREPPPPLASKSVPRTPPRLPSIYAVTPAAYVARASSIELFIIKSSELALQRSSNRRIREFAAIMIERHKGTSAQLSLMGRRLNLLPSAILDSRHQAMFDELQQTPKFDATYRDQQLSVNREAIGLHSQYAIGGTSPTLRSLAATIMPVIQRDSRELTYL